MRLRTIREFDDTNHVKIGSYLDPDNFFETAGAKTFIYNGDGTLHYSANQSVRHIDLAAQYATYYMPDLTDTDFRDFDEVKQAADFSPRFAAVKQFILSDIVPYYRKETDINALLGRIGYDGTFIAFWNDVTKPHLVIPCLRKLLTEKLITPETIYVLGQKRVQVQYILSGTRVYISPEDQKKRKMMQQLHLMPPQQKKATMKDLGLVGGGHKPGWQKASEKSGMVRPGQKWWAATSESIEE